MINSVSSAGRKIVIVWGTAQHYYTFCPCTINPNTTANHTVTNLSSIIVIVLIASDKLMGVALETKFGVQVKQQNCFHYNKTVQ